MPRKAAVSPTTCDGRSLKGMFNAALQLLDEHSAEINALNVFPVPDGDTGTNMLLTMRSSVEEAASVNETSAALVTRAMAHGALMGARGNSGVILSQILRGMAKGLEQKETFDGCDLAAALKEASTMAYRGVSRPVEGTILTVIREVAEAAEVCCNGTRPGVMEVMEATVAAAQESVARTPSLLSVLREAGVVDAGGQGLYVILDGALRFLKGQIMSVAAPAELAAASKPKASLKPAVVSPAPAPKRGEQFYGYCTEFLLQGQGLNVEKMREDLSSLGESLLVVGDETTVRAHIHTFNPGAVLSYATSVGILRQVKMENMDDQHRDFIVTQVTPPPPEAVTMATVAVVAGDGLIQVFRSLGATAIVTGGRTMNPSTEELLQAVDSVPADNVIILPNNKNVVLTANQVLSLTHKKVVVVPTETIPQGVAALLAFNYQAGFEQNVEAMKGAKAGVRTAEITIAVRSVQIGGVPVKKGEIIALLDGDLGAHGDDMFSVIAEVLEKAEAAEKELVTVYYGVEVERVAAEEVARFIRGKCPGQDVELVDGGQLFYHYLISVE